MAKNPDEMKERVQAARREAESLATADQGTTSCWQALLKCCRTTNKALETVNEVTNNLGAEAEARAKAARDRGDQQRADRLDALAEIFNRATSVAETIDGIQDTIGDAVDNPTGTIQLLIEEEHKGAGVGKP